MIFDGLPYGKDVLLIWAVFTCVILNLATVWAIIRALGMAMGILDNHMTQERAVADIRWSSLVIVNALGFVFMLTIVVVRWLS